MSIDGEEEGGAGAAVDDEAAEEDDKVRQLWRGRHQHQQACVHGVLWFLYIKRTSDCGLDTWMVRWMENWRWSK